METDRKHVEDQAAAFVQRRDTGPWTLADQEQLSAWIETSTANRVAFLRSEAAWEAMGRLKALGAGLPPRLVPSVDEVNAAAAPKLLDEHGQSRRSLDDGKPDPLRTRKVAGLAAGVLAVAAGAFWAHGFWFSGEQYVTPVGGLASVPLPDGSHIVLNTASKVRVVLSDSERHVDLAQGEAFFEVAKDAKRPFVVQAKNTKIIAVGTQFSVRRESDGNVQLLVTEGKVRVEGEYPASPAAARSPSLVPASQRTVVSAGEVAEIGVRGLKVQDEPVPQVEDELAWRDGYLVFRETTLADAVAKFNRYSARRIVIADPTVAMMPLTGKFRATNNDAFISLLEQTFHIQAEEGSGQITLRSADSR
jgi:transmembrane sensor